jgi:hypothetical protein
MKHKRVLTSSGRFIDIYDDVFPHYLRERHVTFIQRCNYKLGSRSSSLIWQKDKTNFQFLFSEEDLNKFGFISDELLLKLQGHEIASCWSLASSPFSTYYYHPDASLLNCVSLLYYVNTRWDRNWGGETLFANDEGECEIAVEYKPGRVVLFDSLIPHKPSPVSMQADEFRFTFVIVMKPKVNN